MNNLLKAIGFMVAIFSLLSLIFLSKQNLILAGDEMDPSNVVPFDSSDLMRYSVLSSVTQQELFAVIFSYDRGYLEGRSDEFTVVDDDIDSRMMSFFYKKKISIIVHRDEQSKSLFFYFKQTRVLQRQYVRIQVTVSEELFLLLQQDSYVVKLLSNLLSRDTVLESLDAMLSLLTSLENQSITEELELVSSQATIIEANLLFYQRHYFKLDDELFEELSDEILSDIERLTNYTHISVAIPDAERINADRSRVRDLCNSFVVINLNGTCLN